MSLSTRCREKCCATCHVVKPTDQFYNSSSKKNKDGLRVRCKACDKEKEIACKAKNPERKKRAKNAWYQVNAEAQREYARQRYRRKRDEILAYAKEYGKTHRAQIAASTRNRLAIDASFKIGKYLRNRLGGMMRNQNAQKLESALLLLGCSIESFKIYLESKFESGMSWENYGSHGWHIDHIMPCAIFDLTKPEHQKRCFHFSNMQPMWAEDNLRKNKSVTTNQFQLL